MTSITSNRRHCATITINGTTSSSVAESKSPITRSGIIRLCLKYLIPPSAHIILSLVRKIFHALFRLRAKKLNRHKKDGSWNNTWGMEVNPLNHKEGISIHLVGCPIADFAKKNGYSELMPYFCETDKAVMEHFGGTLYREHTVADGYEDCDYWIKNKGE